MTIWNETFIQTLITDGGTLRDGEKLSRASVWSGMGCNARAAWGLAQGSGKSPYQVCIDLEDGAAKCSCPSRKFPCKHGVGLMLLFVRGSVGAANEPPEWAIAWLTGRDQKREATPAPAKPVDSEARSKREAARAKKVAGGVAELHLFLEDLIRRGLSEPAVKTYPFWDRVAARMADAQMQPIARRLRDLGGIPFQKKPNWVSLLADEIGRLYALTEAYQRIESLPEGLAHDVRTALGFSFKQEEVIELGTRVADRWQILGVTIEKVDKILERRVWLYGEASHRYALILDYAHKNVGFTDHYPLGHSFNGEVVYYPSAYLQRAMVADQKSDFNPIVPANLHLDSTIETILETYADALALNPFLYVIPAGLQRAWIVRDDLVDPAGKALPLHQKLPPQWVTAVMGGDWLPMFGEWDGTIFKLTTIISNDGWMPLED